MIDSAQLLERFRILSRDMKNSLQSSSKNIDALKSKSNTPEINRIETHVNQMAEAWDDFSNWILISTLDDLESAKNNCAPGRLNILSKIARIKKRRESSLKSGRKKIVVESSIDLIIVTYIQYFEQVLDILVENAIKYSLPDGSIFINIQQKAEFCEITVTSYGPTVKYDELPDLGKKGFRSTNSKKLNTTGEGYGLYNASRITTILDGQINFTSSPKTTKINRNIDFSEFRVSFKIPMEIA